MHSKKLLTCTAAFFLCFLCQITTLAQGGWDVWTIYLHDGTRIDAAPVWSLDDKVLKYGMSGEVGEGTQLKRALIATMSRNVGVRQSSGKPALKLPQGEVEKDLVVMGDGHQVSGAVLIRASKDASGEVKYFSPVLVQNGVVTDLTKVEYIKLAKPKRSRQTKRR